MKRLFLLFAALMAFTAVEAQNRYMNISFLNTELKQADFPNLKSNYGASFTYGRIYRLLGYNFRLGLDVTWFDLSYSNYKIKHITPESTDNYNYHQGEIAMHIGPSLTWIPFERMRLHGYFRYAPTYSALYDEDSLYGNYVTMFVGGASITFGHVGIGAEYRFGEGTYKNILSDTPAAKAFDLGGLRTYLSFRF